MSLSHRPRSRQVLGGLNLSSRAIAEAEIQHTYKQGCDKRPRRVLVDEQRVRQLDLERYARTRD